MTKSLGDLLANKFREPPEIKIIKDYVRKHYKSEVSVKVQNDTIVINAPGSALAGALRLDISQLQEALGSSKKLVIRIG